MSQNPKNLKPCRTCPFCLGAPKPWPSLSCFFVSGWCRHLAAGVPLASGRSLQRSRWTLSMRSWPPRSPHLNQRSIEVELGLAEVRIKQLQEQLTACEAAPRIDARVLSLGKLVSCGSPRRTNGDVDGSALGGGQGAPGLPPRASSARIISSNRKKRSEPPAPRVALSFYNQPTTLVSEMKDSKPSIQYQAGPARCRSLSMARVHCGA